MNGMAEIIAIPGVLNMVDEIIRSEKPSIVNGNTGTHGIPMSQKDLEEMYDRFDELHEDDEPISFEKKKTEKKTDKKSKVKKVSAKKKKELTPEQIKAKEERKAQREAQRRAEMEAEIEAERQREAAKEAKRQERRKKEYEIELINLLAKQKFLKARLEEMNPGKEKDAKRIAAFNIELLNIEERINRIQVESGIYLDKLEEGSRVKKFFIKVKTKCKKAVTKVKKFFTKNKEMVIGLASVVLPFIGGCIFKMFAR